MAVCTCLACGTECQSWYIVTLHLIRSHPIFVILGLHNVCLIAMRRSKIWLIADWDAAQYVSVSFNHSIHDLSSPVLFRKMHYHLFNCKEPPNDVSGSDIMFGEWNMDAWFVSKIARTCVSHWYVWYECIVYISSFIVVLQLCKFHNLHCRQWPMIAI